MNLPDDLFPEKVDIQRIAHLYSVEDYNDELSHFWQRNILNYCIYEKLYQISYQDLFKYFTLYGIEPISLENCWQSMKSKRALLSTKSGAEASWGQWLGWLGLTNNTLNKTDLHIFQPLLELVVSSIVLKASSSGQCYFLNQQGLTADTDTQTLLLQTFLLSAVDKVNIASHLHSCACHLFTDPAFCRLVADHTVTLGYSTYVDDERNIIYFQPNNKPTSSSSSSSKNCGEVECARLQLRYSLCMLEGRMAVYESKIADLTAKARRYKVR